MAVPGGCECLGEVPLLLQPSVWFELADQHLLIYLFLQKPKATWSTGQLDRHTHQRCSGGLNPWLLSASRAESQRAPTPAWQVLRAARAVLQSITSCLSSRFLVAGQLEPASGGQTGRAQLPGEITPLASLARTQFKS